MYNVYYYWITILHLSSCKQKYYEDALVMILRLLFDVQIKAAIRFSLAYPIIKPISSIRDFKEGVLIRRI